MKHWEFLGPSLAALCLTGAAVPAAAPGAEVSDTSSGDTSSGGASASALSTPTTGVLERSVLSMGTRLDLRLEGASPERLAEGSEAALREVERIEAACSTWRKDSAWSQLNSSGGALSPLGQEWVRLLSTVLEWNRRTEGAFDPVLGALIRAWGIRQGGRVPSESELAAARQASGASLLVLDPQRGTAQLRHPQAALEEGGFLKGYGLDRMAGVLRKAGVGAAVLNFGGQILVFGRSYRAGIADAQDRHRTRTEVWLSDASLSTSGTSEHGRHILDPHTGQPSEAWGSVSVIAPDGLTADILSTALFVMGPERGLQWANAHHFAALFQRADGTWVRTPRFPAQQSRTHPVSHIRSQSR
jgi:thiamine biosynthesis lipoprotein